MNIPKKLALMLSVLMLVTLLSGCLAAVATGAATGAAVAYDRRTTGTIIDDQSIEFKVRHEVDTFDTVDLKKDSHISIISYNNSVLLVGQVRDETVKEKIAELAEGTEKVRKVYNQLEVMPPISFGQRSKDSWITTKIKSTSLFSREVDPLRTKVITENSVVYLMGIVSHDEAERLSEAARKINGVERVVRVFDYTD